MVDVSPELKETDLQNRNLRCVFSNLKLCNYLFINFNNYLINRYTNVFSSCGIQKLTMGSGSQCADRNGFITAAMSYVKKEYRYY